MNKTIIFAAPLHFNFSNVIKNELQEVGFNVIDISFYGNDFRYKNIFERVQSFIFKNFRGNKFYKILLNFRRNQGWINKKLDKVEKADYCLIIRPDVFPNEILKKIVSKSEKSIGYQWDGLNIFPNVFDKINLFNRFFVFDKNDLSHPNTQISTNFYPQAIALDDTIQETDLYYTGSFNKNRITELENIIVIAEKLRLSVDYKLLSRKKIKK